jgi:hypothetical protein
MSALGQTFKATKVMSALPLKADFCSALVLLWAKSGDCLATLEKPLPLNEFDSGPLHPTLWYGRKRAKIDLAVGGFRILSNVATLSVQKAMEGLLDDSSSATASARVGV